MSTTQVRPPREPRKQPSTLVTQIAANPSLFTVEVGTHAEGGFEITIYESKEAGRMVNPSKAYEQSGFQRIDLAVRALIQFMSKVIEINGTKFKAAHLTALTRKTTGATSYSTRSETSCRQCDNAQPPTKTVTSPYPGGGPFFIYLLLKIVQLSVEHLAHFLHDPSVLVLILWRHQNHLYML